MIKGEILKAVWWLANGEVGVSSSTIVFYAQFGVIPQRGSHPHDPSDFNRCLLMLEHLPWLRGRLNRMEELSPQWAALIARWDEIEATFIGEAGVNWCKARVAPATYKLMRAVIESAHT